MIGRLQGVLLEKSLPDLLVDVHGVGYEVQAPVSTFASLGKVGDPVILYTHLVVREDAHQLFGFSDTSQRTLFRTLIKLNGVGPKLALAILSGMDVQAFARCVHAEDVASLTKLPGVGKKTAERLIVEMRDRLQEWQAPAPLWQASEQAEQKQADDRLREAESALIALGYKPVEASRMLNRVADQASTPEELIRLALRNSLGNS
ncbi:Holliday junction branch migration protein RuvA [Parathalassolituus penaei]|uniref:Holliday junction branch migration complex subunit RuvA n=1 Tax=Parathalassolituus penaei TaxID=2997323 RepID=A0A9X3IQX2_9GAMM|nr:Holliday junction branch migration protein RuvA [Parathalassolituus penaei]MCY0963635.1 Holliday junction branch migration protein RuvA [Parathalassolituus penaei]